MLRYVLITVVATTMMSTIIPVAAAAAANAITANNENNNSKQDQVIVTDSGGAGSTSSASLRGMTSSLTAAATADPTRSVVNEDETSYVFLQLFLLQKISLNFFIGGPWSPSPWCF